MFRSYDCFDSYRIKEKSMIFITILGIAVACILGAPLTPALITGALFQCAIAFMQTNSFACLINCLSLGLMYAATLLLASIFIQPHAFYNEALMSFTKVLTGEVLINIVSIYTLVVAAFAGAKYGSGVNSKNTDEKEKNPSHTESSHLSSQKADKEHASNRDESSSQNDGDATTSFIVGMATNNALIGYMAGGSLMGAVAGDIANDGSIGSHRHDQDNATSYDSSDSSASDSSDSDSSSSSGD